MEVLNMIFYTGITLGVLVFIHEFGHFIAAKLTGMRVDVFSIGFPPRAFGKKIGDTDYCISWVPLGGYVKIAGMVDESFDTEFEHREVQPWEFRAKPLWARSIVISAGVIMNLLLAIGIFWGIQYSRGAYIIETTEIGYVQDSSIAAIAGLQRGDKISAVNGKPTTNWQEVNNAIFLDDIGKDLSLSIDRNGSQTTILLPALSLHDSARGDIGIVEAHTVPLIAAVEPGMPAEKLGLMAGDTITAVNEHPVFTDLEMRTMIHANAGKELQIQWKRNTELMSGTTTVSPKGIIGIRIGTVYTGPSKIIQYSLFEAFPLGVREVFRVIDLIFQSFRNIIFGSATVKESFGGPIRIAQMATQSAEFGLASFLTFMAMLSVSLAVLNIFPIPALDGGHLFMMIAEKIAGREIPVNVKLGIQKVGFVLLLAFMAFVIYNDISTF